MTVAQMLTPAQEYLKQIELEWFRLAVKNANGNLLRSKERNRFLELKEMRKRVGKSWQV